MLSTLNTFTTPRRLSPTAGKRRRLAVGAAAALLLGGLLVAPSAQATSATPLGTLTPAATLTETFTYTGAAQTWVVPSGVTSVNVVVSGAQGGDQLSVSGGSNFIAPGGLGGTTRATLTVTPDDTLHIYVGGKGGTATLTGGGAGGFNGGGDSGITLDGDGVVRYAGAGGGASDIRVGGTSLADRVVVAGGGGGTTVVGTGGSGGGVRGAAGPTSDGGVSGGGGTDVAAGAGGAGAGVGGLACPAPGASGTAGASGVGGSGGAPGSGGANPKMGGGGGGGGYFGGGGGGGSCDQNLSSGAGGGGSAYAGPGTSGATLSSSSRAGNGLVTITYEEPPPGVEASVSGRTITGGGYSFPAASEVTLTLGDVIVGTATTTADGEFEFELTDIDCAITGGTLTATSGDTTATTEVTLEPCPGPTTTTTVPASTTTAPPSSTTTPDPSPTVPDSTPASAGASSRQGGLPVTGAGVAPLVTTGVLLLTSGAGALGLAMRRRRSGDDA